MSLVLYYHPLASFCHKVLIALYENETPFVPSSYFPYRDQMPARFAAPA